MARTSQRAENFLSLVGFVIVVLGGIGVWSVTRVFVRQKIRSVAILKCVGASTTQVLATYVLQVALLAIAGSLIGVLMAGVAMHAIPASLTASFGGCRTADRGRPWRRGSCRTAGVECSSRWCRSSTCGGSSRCC